MGNIWDDSLGYFWNSIETQENTNKVTVLVAILSFVFIVVTYRVARRALHAPLFTRIEIKDFSIIGNDPKFVLYSTGPGIAFNVRLYAGKFSIKFDPLGKDKFWVLEQPGKVVGPSYMQPNTEVDYVFEDPWLSINLHRPFIIRYELASQRKMEIYIKYVSSDSRSDRLQRLSSWQIKWEKLRSLCYMLRHPFKIWQHHWRSWRADRVAVKDEDTHNQQSQ